ncbi:MAG: signal recognition particle-docking protein FtsY [Coriobacteriia bacterium]|nr:signal recognition particle-docking protein FtsY [Coriobacteriia bacterium]MCL2870232.1 signal recognition particle-docking protein FtsY [Coriobacteriia bacterium]
MSSNRSWKERLSSGLAKSRERLGGQLNTLMGRVVEIDDDFYDELEETLISADFGFEPTMDIVSKLREQVAARAIGDMDGVRELLIEIIASEFETAGDPFQFSPVTILMVGINGTGKTTSTGKLAKQAVDAGRKVILGSADTFRAAAAEQLDIWAERAGVEIVRRDRGTDPASVSYATVEAAQEMGADLALIDTAGRLHTSPDLMRELEKVQRVTREKSTAPTFTVLVIDATTGQNGLVQAREFNKLLSVDALILTKLDGTAKGGIALPIARELKVPIVRIGVGESIEDLRPFNPEEFAEALIGA